MNVRDCYTSVESSSKLSRIAGYSLLLLVIKLESGRFLLNVGNIVIVILI